MATTLSVDTDLPVVDDPSQSDLVDSKPPTAVTPDGKSLGSDDAPTAEAAGDTESETSVASTQPEALEILFGKEQSKSSPEKKPDPDGVEKEKPDPEGVTVEEEAESNSKPAACITPSAADVLPSPPHKINRVSITAANFSRPSTPSVASTPRRTGGSGLSELSKQLRVLQAKNQYMQSEMERCQRQLKIMSESKGVSVAEVLQSMETACAKEAHAELQSQIVGLQAQLEALQAGKSPARAGAATSKATQLEHDSLKQQIAALQLQVGNLEELEAELKEETKSLYAKVQTHQTAALTLESTVAGQATLLETEQARTAALEAEVKALREERDVLKEKQTKRMADFWQHTLQKNWSLDEGDDWQGGEVQKYMGLNRVDKDRAGAIPAPTNYPPPGDDDKERPRLQRTFSDPALWTEVPDAKAHITKGYVSSMLPKYSSSYKQWTYDVADDTHRSRLYVKQSAKNMELEVLCRHQQQTIQDLQEDITKDTAARQKMEMERSMSVARKNIFEQQVSSLELDLRLEKEQAESLRGQLRRREDEFSLKKEQLQSRLQHGKERIVDLEGQLCSLYVAYELVLEDRSEEQTEQAELKMRLVDADTAIAKQMVQPTPSAKSDAAMARQLSGDLSSRSFTTMDQDVSESSTKSETASIRQRAGLLTPSPRKSKLNLFKPSSLRSLQPPAPQSASGRRASTNDLKALGKPPTAPKEDKRRASVGSKYDAPPPPGTTICKGFLMQLHSKKKKIFGGGDVGVTWKRKYMVLKRGEGIMGAGTYCIWWGDEPQQKVRGTVPHIIRGISTVSFKGSLTSDPDGKPHSFVIRINPNDPKAPEIHLAAYSAVELEQWKQALQLEIDVDNWSEYEQRRAENQIANAKQKNYL